LCFIGAETFWNPTEIGVCCSLFLVEKKPIDMYFHMVTVAFSTWSHAPRVMENGYLTLKQAQKNVATTKHNAGTKLSCGTLKTLLPT